MAIVKIITETIMRIEREQIRFKADNGVCTTPCEYFTETMVGSLSCRRCRYYVQRDGEYIICSYDATRIRTRKTMQGVCEEFRVGVL